jgi:mRNA-degrading endonuclease RelE of RelBE toxin-antitoxin system
MAYKIKPISRFNREFKRLKKKYPSFLDDVTPVVQSLLENPTLGESIGHDCYKIRVAISSKGKGKSGGARLITYIYFSVETIYLLSIYDKSEQANISEKEILALLKQLEN